MLRTRLPCHRLEAVFAAALRALEQGEEVAMVTIVSTQGSTPQRVGAKMLVYEKKWNPQEVEFTYEGPEEKDFYILQTRDMVSTKRVTFEVFSPSVALRHDRIQNDFTLFVYTAYNEIEI